MSESKSNSGKEVQLNVSSMQYVRLGQSGLKVSRLSLGCMTYGSPKWREWVLDEAASKPFIKAALDKGINFFDTADMYSNGESERVLGNILKEFGTRREELVIATKVFFSADKKIPNNGGLSRKHIMDAIDASLKRLQMDYVDLYQIHRFDPNTPMEETMEALHDVVKSGKARYIGASSMYTWQFAEMQHIAERRGWTQFVSMQNHWNAVYREEEREMVPYCVAHGVGIIPWSPLARGFLAGGRAKTKQEEQADKTNNTVRARTDDFAQNMYYQPEDHVVAQRVAEVAEKKGVKPAQIALAWLLHQNGCTAPIIGASKLYQLEEAVDAIKIKLDKDELKALEEPYKPHKVLGNLS